MRIATGRTPGLSQIATEDPLSSHPMRRPHFRMGPTRRSEESAMALREGRCRPTCGARRYWTRNTRREKDGTTRTYASSSGL